MSLCWSPLNVTTTTVYDVPAVNPVNTVLRGTLVFMISSDPDTPVRYTLYPDKPPDIGGSHVNFSELPVLDSMFRFRGA